MSKYVNFKKYRLVIDTCDITVEKHNIAGIEYEVIFVPKEFLPHPDVWGCAYWDCNGPKVAHVLNTLTGATRRFVVQHELYHLRDPFTWGGRFGSEFRANFIPGISDPIGLITVIWKTLLIPERRKFYRDLIQGKISFRT